MTGGGAEDGIAAFGSKAADEAYERQLWERLGANPDDVATLIDLGAWLHTDRMDPDRGQELLERALKLDPDNVDAMFWLANLVRHEQCDYERACSLLKRALELDPNRADCLSSLSSTLVALDAPTEDCLNLTERAAQLEPDWPMVTLCLVGHLVDAGRRGDAEEMLERFVRQIEAQRWTGPNSYFERVVTGRAWRDWQWQVEDSRLRIRRMRPLD